MGGVTAYELLFGQGYNSEEKDELAYVTKPPRIDAQETKLSRACCDFVHQCLTVDDEQRWSSAKLWKHKWCALMKERKLAVKWKPWLVDVAADGVIEREVLSGRDRRRSSLVEDAMAISLSPKSGAQGKVSKKEVGKSAKNEKTQKKQQKQQKEKPKPPPKGNVKSKNDVKQKKQPTEQKEKPPPNAAKESSDAKRVDARKVKAVLNEDLLFMISALVIYYMQQTADLDAANKKGKRMLHRRKSNHNATEQEQEFTDEDRIANMAKYALCTPQTVKDRIRGTVSFVMSQLGKNEKSQRSPH